MSASNKWKKILKDTEQSDLTDQQIFWRSVAFLRLGNSKPALATFEQLSSRQFSKIEFILHASELYLKNNLITQGEQLLIESFAKANKDDKHLKQWLFIAKRYSAPSDKLKNLIQRTISKQDTQPTTFNFSDKVSWHRAQKLNANRSNTNFYLAWLEWLLKKECSPEQLHNFLENTLNNLPKQSFLAYQIFEKLKHQNFWPELIEYVFHYQHLTHTQPDLMWKQWWKHCPNSYREILRAKMLAALERRPNSTLEKLLIEFSNNA